MKRRTEEKIRKEKKRRGLMTLNENIITFIHWNETDTSINPSNHTNNPNNHLSSLNHSNHLNNNSTNISTNNFQNYFHSFSILPFKTSNTVKTLTLTTQRTTLQISLLIISR